MELAECGWCRIPFWRHPFSKLELHELRESLLVADPNYEPIICDVCHKTVVDSAPKHVNPPKFIMNVA